MRPSVDVVIPFRGSTAELEALRERARRLQLRPGDSVVVVDNGPGEAPISEGGAVTVVRAAELQTPGYARNRGAAAGSAEWIVFIDADTEPELDLLDRYFDPHPASATGLVGGGVRDEAVMPDRTRAARYAYIRAAMSQDDTFRFGVWGFPKAANAAVRRTAFEEVGGFSDRIRAAEDADLSYRLRAAGWDIERREDATVTHLSRHTLRSFVAQKLVHGSGGAWLEHRYPGSFPARGRLGLAWWGVRTATRGLAAAARTGDRDRAIWALFEPIEALAFELGRSLPNERPLPARPWWRALERL